jgi:hypothetical protein
MRSIKNYFWIIPFLGVVMCIIALFAPAAYFENVIWNHEIINWIWGFYQDTFNSIITSGFYEESIQLLPSIIASSIIVGSIIASGIGLLRNRKNKKSGIVDLLVYILPALCIIIILFFWMVMMELAEQTIWGISMWQRYIPGFGIIGLFTGASLIIIGGLAIKYSSIKSTKEIL